MSADKLEKALKIISSEDKMILQLKYQDDVSIKEIQEVLNIFENALKMKLHHVFSFHQ